MPRLSAGRLLLDTFCAWLCSRVPRAAWDAGRLLHCSAWHTFADVVFMLQMIVCRWLRARCRLESWGTYT